MCIPKAGIRPKFFQQRGVSLVELVVFIVIVSVALAGTLLIMNQTTRSSADPVIRKQSLAIAESLLEEITLMPFTFCDPDDAQAITAMSPTVGPSGCAAMVESMGPRYAGATPFDNVNDYHNFQMNAGNGGIRDITGAVIADLDGYAAAVSVTPSALGGIPAADALLITVTVTGPNAEPVVQQGYRTRYSPRTTP